MHNALTRGRRFATCRMTTCRLVWLVAIVLAGLAFPRPVEASVMCDWFGRCFYESPGFHVRVVDKETGKPLAGVHALAEWVLVGFHGRNGPLMVQDAVSNAEGVMKFPAWGPIRGAGSGLMLNLDPGISFFKPGYKVLRIQNAYPEGMTETTRVRYFGEDGKTFALEPFRGGPEQLFEELKRAGEGFGGRAFEEQVREFRNSFLNRTKRVIVELKKLPRSLEIEARVETLEREVKWLEELQ